MASVIECTHSTLSRCEFVHCWRAIHEQKLAFRHIEREYGGGCRLSRAGPQSSLFGRRREEPILLLLIRETVGEGRLAFGDSTHRCTGSAAEILGEAADVSRASCSEVFSCIHKPTVLMLSFCVKGKVADYYYSTVWQHSAAIILLIVRRLCACRSIRSICSFSSHTSRAKY